jgi:hypothetical protein
MLRVLFIIYGCIGQPIQIIHKRKDNWKEHRYALV